MSQRRTGPSYREASLLKTFLNCSATKYPLKEVAHIIQVTTPPVSTTTTSTPTTAISGLPPQCTNYNKLNYYRGVFERGYNVDGKGKWYCDQVFITFHFLGSENYGLSVFHYVCLSACL